MEWLPSTRTLTTRYVMAAEPMGFSSLQMLTWVQVFRNVKDYGAKGDGVTDDTEAINRAINDGNRCGEECGSSTVHPALVYFPSGRYLVSSTLIMYYNTQIVGNVSPSIETPRFLATVVLTFGNSPTTFLSLSVLQILLASASSTPTHTLRTDGVPSGTSTRATSFVKSATLLSTSVTSSRTMLASLPASTGKLPKPPPSKMSNLSTPTLRMSVSVDCTSRTAPVASSPT